jgi:hypothetical protein
LESGATHGGSLTLETAMSSFALTALAAMSPYALDSAFEMAQSQASEPMVRFGDGAHGAALPSSSGLLDAAYRAGSGASGHVAAATPEQSEPRMHSGYAAFDAAPHYSGVLMQQGRVQTDADYNEATAVDETKSQRFEVTVATLQRHWPP